MKRVMPYALVLALCSIGTPVAFTRITRAPDWQWCGELVSRVETTERVVALTFDDGPSERGLDAVLPVLKARAIPATFFLIGRTLERNPDLGARLLGDGHELGNHSYSHRPMLWLSQDDIAREVESTDAILRRVGFRGPILFRPPFGRKLLGLPWYLASTQRTTIMWDVDPESYVQAASDLVAYTREHVRPGSIIILHPMTKSGGETRAALPAIIDGLLSDGYRFVTVSELLALQEHSDAVPAR